jgi:pyridoxal phosphate enzyme (YggS family)
MQTYLKGFSAVRGRVAEALIRAGRGPSEAELIAVSKTHPAEAVRALLGAGHFLFGESRVQEALAKIPRLPAAARWHFIGHLQKNKIRKALPLFEMFHGVDSVEIARDMNRVALELGLRPRILLEVNVAGEATKFGFSPDSIRSGLEAVLGLEALQVEGFMTMAPFSDEPENSRPVFARMRELSRSLQEEFQRALPHLSMGMSGDYEVAAEEGATLLRVGTAIFGER